MADDPATKICEEYDKHLLDSIKGSHEQYDKAILTLSSGGLALSITLLKDLFPVDKVILPGVIASSWYLFGVAIISTILSFLTSIVSVNTQRDYFHKYYIEKILEYRDKRNWWTVVTKWLNRISAICFIAGIVATIVFAQRNFSEKLKKTPEKTSPDAKPTIQKPYSSAKKPVAKKKKKALNSENAQYKITINGTGQVTMNLPPKELNKMGEGTALVPSEVTKPSDNGCKK